MGEERLEGAPPAQTERATSITDLTGCKIVKGKENFTFGGDYFKLSVYSPNHETLVASGGKYNPDLPGFNDRKDKEAFFCFQAEYDCERFLAAVSDLFFCNACSDLELVSDGFVALVCFAGDEHCGREEVE
jgi:hypothetical protein